jgi:hypothetical protein
MLSPDPSPPLARSLILSISCSLANLSILAVRKSLSASLAALFIASRRALGSELIDTAHMGLSLPFPLPLVFELDVGGGWRNDEVVRCCCAEIDDERMSRKRVSAAIDRYARDSSSKETWWSLAINQHLVFANPEGILTHSIQLGLEFRSKQVCPLASWSSSKSRVPDYPAYIISSSCVFLCLDCQLTSLIAPGIRIENDPLAYLSDDPYLKSHFSLVDLVSILVPIPSSS